MISRKVQVAVLTCLFGVVGIAAAQEKTAAPERDRAGATPEDRAVAAQLEKRLPEIRFEGQGFADVVDFLRDVSAANMFVEWTSVEKAGVNRNAPVTVVLKDVKFKTGLEKILESVSTPKTKLGFTTRNGVIIIAPAGGAAQKPRVTGKLPPDIDRRLPEINFNGQGLGDVLDFLRDVSGRNLFVNWRELEAAGINKKSPVHARLRDVPLSTTLAVVLASVSDGKAPLEFYSEDGVISIKAAAKAEDRKEAGEAK